MEEFVKTSAFIKNSVVLIKLALITWLAIKLACLTDSTINYVLLVCIMQLIAAEPTYAQGLFSVHR